jgi:hypothetical protein
MSIMSIETSVLDASAADSMDRNEPVAARTWLEPALTALFTTVGILLVSAIAVITGIR